VSSVTRRPGGRLEKYFCLYRHIAISIPIAEKNQHGTYLFGRSVLSGDESDHMRLRHGLDSFPFALLAIPLLIHLVNHTLIDWRLMAVAVIRHVAAIAKNDHIARRTDTSQADLAYCTLGIPAIGPLFLVGRHERR
jgi:hypothetical protein